ncbi:hypothetical protein [Rhizobium leguminosarum]|uniref:hypothetical protein n=1 Tax=Rhizobium leguminosarum TaxID=384 RepID=UPI002E157A90|nr:hypothetical protein U8Q02_41190 [Rhizobium leguminosarum]
MISYTVEGRWPFPTDMLRHDQSRAASPADEEKIAALSGDFSPGGEDRLPKFRIDLVIDEPGHFRPNTERWESFDWDVINSPDSRVHRQKNSNTAGGQVENMSGADPVRAALLRCKECWEDDEAADVGREKLEALTVFGLLRKVGRGRWEITPVGMALLSAPGDPSPVAQEFAPHVETVRRCEEIARYFADHEFRNVAPGFIRGVAYASESIAMEISDLVPGAPRAPIIAAPDFVGPDVPLAPQDYQLLSRLLEQNTAEGARPVIEKDTAHWTQALRLSDMGMIAIEQLGVGGRLHITRLGGQLVKAALTVSNEKDETND